jgi:integrase
MAIRKLRNRPARPWQVYWTDPLDGKRESKTFTTVREAREFDSEISHRIEFKPESFQREGHTGPDASFAALAMSYLRRKQFTPTNTRHTTNHLRPVMAVIGNLSAEQVTRQALRLLVLRLEESGLKQNGINRKISIVKAVLAWAEDEELITVNHARGFRCPRGEDAKIPPPTPAEVGRIYAVAPEHLRRVVLLGFYLGARVGPSELFRLRWDHFDLERKKVIIQNADKKRKTPWREIDLFAPLVPLLREWQADGCEYPIHYLGKPVGHVKRAWAKALADAGIARWFTPYSLRHAFATYSLESGADIKAVSEIMGHQSTAMIHRHYQHVLGNQRKAAIDGMPDLVRANGSQKIPDFAPKSANNSKKLQ